MKRKNKKRTKKIIAAVTVLLVLLFGAMLIMEKYNDKTPSEGTNSEKPSDKEASVEPENSETEDPKLPELEPIEPEPQDPLTENGTVQNPDKIDVLVNRKSNLPSTYVPEDLVTLSEVPTVLQNPEVNQMRKAAYEALKELFEAAMEEEGFELYARSGYRSYNTQTALYSSYVESNGQEAADKYSAKPGQSEHQTGLAIDITCGALNYTLDTTFADTDEGKWVAENAHRFGYIIRYPKDMEDITGYLYEPWHIRYLGVELATKVYESGLTLEEYFE